MAKRVKPRLILRLPDSARLIVSEILEKGSPKDRRDHVESLCDLLKYPEGPNIFEYERAWLIAEWRSLFPENAAQGADERDRSVLHAMAKDLLREAPSLRMPEGNQSLSITYLRDLLDTVADLKDQASRQGCSLSDTAALRRLAVAVDWIGKDRWNPFPTKDGEESAYQRLKYQHKEAKKRLPGKV